MRLLIFILITFTFSISSEAKFAPPLNDDINGAINITNTSAFCTTDAAYENFEATTSPFSAPSGWGASAGKDVWFKFTASKYDVNISVSGQVNSSSTNTLINPLVALYTYDAPTANLNEMPSNSFTSNNVTSLNKGGLTIGTIYYIRVSAQNDQTGTFKLCLDNYFPPLQPGQDCGTVSVLCTKETFTQLNVTGAGLNNHETDGTCLGTESNSAWYLFTASESGTFTFLITPTVTTNDIDWVFYDLGVGGNCANVSATTAIRCASGSGVDCFPSYYKTGLSLTETDLNESSGCVDGQNGLVKYVDLVKGRTYALIIDNFSSGNNGFTLEFGGTADFAGAKAEIDVKKLNPCTDNQAYVFESKSSNYNTLKWTFGEGASTASETTEGPFTITYSTPGEKVVVLEAMGANGCSVISTQTFIVAKTPDKPVVNASKTNLCVGDVLELSTPQVNYATYHWTGPNGFTSSEQNPKIPITGIENVGEYKLFIQVGDCVSDLNSIKIQSVDLIPKAVFSCNVNNKCEQNQSFTFTNSSTNYTKIKWDFGEGVDQIINTQNDSREVTYSSIGEKTIILIVETNNGCTSTQIQKFIVEIKPDKPIISINQPAFCLNDVIEFTVNKDNTLKYLWTGPNNFTASDADVKIPINNFNQAGTYYLTATAGSCTSDIASITVPPIAKIPIASFTTTPNFNIKFSPPVPINFNNNSLYADFYEWDFGDGTTSLSANPLHTYNQSGTYKITLKATSKNGCWNSVTKGDLVILKNASIFTPNAFSPNGDGINDEFVVGITNLVKYRLQIYNRLGNQVFFTDNIFDNWNGRFKNEDLPVGVYYYVIFGTDIFKKDVKYSGYITLIR
ncbi:PKD domain-containing protein [Pedobacter changchengzhani]|uniref:PKD domain-containing protein n=1 Tax=Pedobacter changchengzhani TaxID=2529274 RepID=A0A4R5MJK0_9SPHI|nr:PKD domain-containing protein [Pedobacter changchengzhani]TDG35259.1 PKD domain-containing protein [Pedobacter changchengzhani]